MQGKMQCKMGEEQKPKTLLEKNGLFTHIPRSKKWRTEIQIPSEKGRTKNITLCYYERKNRKTILYMKLQREEQKTYTLYENAKGRTENSYPI